MPGKAAFAMGLGPWPQDQANPPHCWQSRHLAELPIHQCWRYRLNFVTMGHLRGATAKKVVCLKKKKQNLGFCGSLVAVFFTLVRCRDWHEAEKGPVVLSWCLEHGKRIFLLWANPARGSSTSGLHPARGTSSEVCSFNVSARRMSNLI